MKFTLDELKELINLNEKEFMSNRTFRYSARYSIIQIVEAMSDLGIHILERKFNEKVESYREIFEKLMLRGVINPRTYEGIQGLVSLRNIIVHRYWRVDDLRIYRIAKENGIRRIENFLREVMEYASKDN